MEHKYFQLFHIQPSSSICSSSSSSSSSSNFIPNRKPTNSMHE